LRPDEAKILVTGGMQKVVSDTAYAIAGVMGLYTEVEANILASWPSLGLKAKVH